MLNDAGLGESETNGLGDNETRDVSNDEGIKKTKRDKVYSCDKCDKSYPLKRTILFRVNYP